MRPGAARVGSADHTRDPGGAASGLTQLVALERLADNAIVRGARDCSRLGCVLSRRIVLVHSRRVSLIPGLFVETEA